MENEATVVAGIPEELDYTVPRRVQRLDAARGAVLCITLVLAASIYSFRMMSFLHAKEAALCVGLALMAGLVMARGRFYTNGLKAFAPLWILLAISLLRAALLPTAVASDAVLSALRYALVLLTVVLAFDLLAQETWRLRVLDALLVSALGVAVLAYVQYFNLVPRLFPVFPYAQRAYSVFGNQDYLGGYLALIMPAALYRGQGDKGWCWGMAVFILLMPALLISGCRSAWLAAAAGLLFVLPHLVARPGRNVFLAGVVTVLLGVTASLAPQSTGERVQKAFAAHDEGRDTRLWLWRAGHGMFSDYPLLGVGLGNYGYWSPSYLGELAAVRPPDPAFDIERHADQPHSEAVRVVAEMGMVGVLLCASMVIRLLGRRGGAEWGVLAAFGVFALFNGVFDSVPHALAGALMAGMLMARGRAEFWESRRVSSLLPIGVTAACLLQVWAVLTPSIWLARADDARQAGEPSLRMYERVVGHPWPNALGHKKHAEALAASGRGLEAYVAYLQALRGLDTGDIYLAVATLMFNGEDPKEARKWVDECLKRWPDNAEVNELQGALYADQPGQSPSGSI